MNPIGRFILGETLISRPSRIIEIPIAQNTVSIIKLYCGLKLSMRLISKISAIASQAPRFIRNRLASAFDLFLPERKAEVPDKKTKTGAQKWVIQRVKKSAGVVV